MFKKFNSILFVFICLSTAFAWAQKVTGAVSGSSVNSNQTNQYIQSDQSLSNVYFSNSLRLDQSFLNDFVGRNWTTSDGLAGMTITSLEQDYKGYIYIGTYDGLVRFDGVEFETISRKTDSKYDFTSARTIFKDSKNNIWVGHNDEGVTKISADGSVRKFTSKQGVPNNSIRSICEDLNGNIWIGTAAGVCYINEIDQVTHPNTTDSEIDIHAMVESLFCDTAGRVWICTNMGGHLYYFLNREIHKFEGLKSFEDVVITTVSQDSNGDLFFGVAPHYLVRLHDDKETIYNLKQGQMDGTVVTKIMQDHNSNIWIGSDSGLAIIHSGSISLYNKNNGLPEDKINDIHEDFEGNIWIGFDRGGLYKLSQGRFRTTPMETSINAICVDSTRNVIWFGGDDGLYCLKDSQFIQNELTMMCRNVRIRHIEMTYDNELLVSTYSSLGQLKMDSEGNISSWSTDNGLCGNKTRVAIKARDGKYYIGTTLGITIISDEGFQYITKENGISNEFIMAIYEDRNGRIWFGTDGGGLYILENGKVTRTYNTNQGLAGNVIFKILELNDGEIWITTGTGASRYNPSDDSFSNIDSTKGLSTDGVFQMLADYTEVVWLTTNHGIFSIKLEDLEAVADGKKELLQIRKYGKSDGLVSGGVTATSLSCKDSLGRIWFTLIDGFAMYNPVKATLNKNAPVVEIQEYTVDNVRTVYSGEKIVLAPDAKRLNIKFTGISFVSSEQLRFSYKLEGFEEDYSEWSSLRSVSYTNLKPGKYQLTILSQNGDEVVSAPCEPIIIVKKHYFWQLWYFWVISAIVLCGLIGFIVYMKISSMKKYQVELENKVQDRTKALKLEKEKSEGLLLNILPKDVAKELTDKPNQTIAKKVPKATVLFTDIVGFTKISDGLNPEEIVTLLNKVVSLFDERAKAEGIEKIKTIGDSYMAAAGLTENSQNDGARKIIRFAMGIYKDLEEFNKTSSIKLQMRIGINTGDLVAGVIGKSKFIYDVWGDTVNVASRMESTGKPMRIHVTEQTYLETKDFFDYCEEEEVEVKGKGKMKTYFLK